jgi:hypothetical protein
MPLKARHFDPNQSGTPSDGDAAVGLRTGPPKNSLAGRKPIPTRCVLEAVLWILNTGAQWHMLPQSYPNYNTVHRRFQTWCRDEVLRRVLTDVANELRDRGALNEEECFIDATFVMAKGGGSEIGTTKRGKGMKIMAIVDRHGRVYGPEACFWR